MPLDENLLDAAIAGKEVQAIYAVAKAEGVRPNILLKQVSLGRIVIMLRDGKQPLGIGESLRTKINANIGTSAEVFDSKRRSRRPGWQKNMGLTP
jgi:phosphomethylpyrimidine synthase